MRVTTMQGKVIDMATLRGQNEKSIAVGNAGVNARGDRLGRGGEVVRTKEEVVAEYYRENPRAVEVASMSLRSIDDEVMTPAEALQKLEGQIPAPKKPKKKITLSDE